MIRAAPTWAEDQHTVQLNGPAVHPRRSVLAGASTRRSEQGTDEEYEAL
jgi:hypothetical protein